MKSLLTNDESGVLYRSPRAVNACSQGAEPVFIWWRYTDEGCIEADDVPTKQQRDLTEEDGHEISTTRVHSLTQVSSGEEGVVSNDT